MDSAGNLFIASSNRIRKVSADGIITTIAGNGAKGFSGDGGPALEAQLDAPEVVAVDAVGNVFFADYDSARIRKVSPDGIITTIAGNGTKGYSGDGGVATDASISAPRGIAVDGAGNVYFADLGAIRVLRPVNRPQYLIPPTKVRMRTDALADYWRRRWVLKRLRKEGILAQVAEHSLVYPIRHGAQVQLPPDPELILPRWNSVP